MGSDTHLSGGNLRRYGKSSSRSCHKSSMPTYSDYYEEKDDSAVNLGQRSISLTVLHPGQQPPAPLQPRMAQLQTLEAKMASIEVSLSTAPRRKRNGSIGGGGGGGGGVQAGGGGGGGSPVHRTSKDIAKELEVLRNALRDKENMIQSLKGQLCNSLSISRLSATYLRGQHHPGQAPLTDKERRAAEERLARLRADMDNKRLAIKNLKMALERLDITDNIDVRIQQAELEYQLGREELNLLTVLEETRSLQLCLEDAEQSRARADQATLYNHVQGAQLATLHAVELNYDPKSPRFGASPRDDGQGLYVEWAAQDCGMIRGDRVLEVNGKLVLTKTKDEMVRLLAVAPDPAQLVLLRRQATAANDNAVPSHGHALELQLRSALERAQEAETAKEALKTDNVRLSHRISYLEEQVSELLDKVRDADSFPKASSDLDAASLHSPSPVSSRMAPATPAKADVQVFQKGPQVTAIVANLPGLEVGGSSPVESRHALPTLRPKTSVQPVKSHDARSTKSLDVVSNCSSTDVAPHHHHRHHHGRRKHDKHAPHHNLQSAQSTNSLDTCSKDYHSALNPRSRYHSQFYLSEQAVKTVHSVSDYASEASSTVDVRHYHKKYSDSLRRKSEHHFATEARNGRSHVDYASESSTGTYHRAHRSTRSMKSLDKEVDPSRSSQKQYAPDGWPCSLQSQSIMVESKSSTTLDDASETSSKLSHQHRHNVEGGDGKPQRPKPPKKPIRLSLSRATSLQVMNTSPPATPTTLPANGSRKPTKRSHSGESPLAPGRAETPTRTPSRAESCQPTMRWSSPAPQPPHPRSCANGYMAPGEKWC